MHYALLWNMTLTKLIRPIYRVVKKSVKSGVATLNSFKYLNSSARNQSRNIYLGNVLVVKKPIYAKLARLCVESFLYYNPGCKIIVNVDSATEQAVSKAFRKAKARRNIEIRNLGDCGESWQEIKLKLILAMKDPQEFFMDADLRWNGPIPELNGTTFFVNEFKLKETYPYSNLLEMSNWQSRKEFTMKNTSFLYWGGFKPERRDELFIQEAMCKIQELYSQDVISKENADSMNRISEQIALSVLVDVRNQDVKFLKETDGYRDGTFVESSYFGATGSIF